MARTVTRFALDGVSQDVKNVVPADAALESLTFSMTGEPKGA
jgi:hypothetical protein